MSAHPDAAGGLDPSLTAALSQELTRHARLLHVMKAQMAALVPAGLDAAAFPLLHTLVRCGPRRQGELAEQALLDPSTVSRYVGQLARAGYVERRPDPQDGRAVQLAATEAGTAVAHELGARRQAAVAEALGGWEHTEIERLVALLGRLNDDLEAFRPQIVRAIVGPPARGPEQHPSAPLPDPRTPDQENA
jgi:DNA-binding MarR family transcriptional regulator